MELFSGKAGYFYEGENFERLRLILFVLLSFTKELLDFMGNVIVNKGIYGFKRTPNN